jgi:hypothetical protein
MDKKDDLQFLISDMNTDKPRIPSPLTGGVIVQKRIESKFNSFRVKQKFLS